MVSISTLLNSPWSVLILFCLLDFLDVLLALLFPLLQGLRLAQELLQLSFLLRVKILSETLVVVGITLGNTSEDVLHCDQLVHILQSPIVEAQVSSCILVIRVVGVISIEVRVVVFRALLRLLLLLGPRFFQIIQSLLVLIIAVNHFIVFGRAIVLLLVRLLIIRELAALVHVVLVVFQVLHSLFVDFEAQVCEHFSYFWQSLGYDGWHLASVHRDD